MVTLPSPPCIVFNLYILRNPQTKTKYGIDLLYSTKIKHTNNDLITDHINQFNHFVRIWTNVSQPKTNTNERSPNFLFLFLFIKKTITFWSDIKSKPSVSHPEPTFFYFPFRSFSAGTLFSSRISSIYTHKHPHKICIKQKPKSELLVFIPVPTAIQVPMSSRTNALVSTDTDKVEKVFFFVIILKK